jgi:hypothetical protein
LVDIKIEHGCLEETISELNLKTVLYLPNSYGIAHEKNCTFANDTKNYWPIRQTLYESEGMVIAYRDRLTSNFQR